MYQASSNKLLLRGTADTPKNEVELGPQQEDMTYDYSLGARSSLSFSEQIARRIETYILVQPI
jgi:hypothetical protein